jgi:hypothetical protein
MPALAKLNPDLAAVMALAKLDPPAVALLAGCSDTATGLGRLQAALPCPGVRRSGGPPCAPATPHRPASQA